MAFGEESFLELIEAWDGLGVVVRRDRDTGSWIFIAIHDDTLGRAVGGCRMKAYPTPEDGLRDALRLARGMTRKWAAIDYPFGGAKAVIAVPAPLHGTERAALFRRFGALLNTLKGAYGTGEDLGTTPSDMREISSVSAHVIGLHGIHDGPVDPGPFTARGVFEGLKAALRHRVGTDDLAGRSVLIQGVGDVGAPLARLVAGAGGDALLTDLDTDRAFAISVEVGGSVVPQDDVYDTVCDVYAPCAVGATLNPDTIPRLRCEIVAGSANNQLESDDDAQRLMDRGILYAPDYVVNAGGAMAFALVYDGERDTETLERRVAGIGNTLDEIFNEAAEIGESPVVAAMRRVERVLSRGRSSTVG
jgi:leucine dehydrogenase